MAIALKGPSQCGKSTLAKLLSDHYTAVGYPVVRTSFSDFVREEIVDAYQTWAIGIGKVGYLSRLSNVTEHEAQTIDTLLNAIIREYVGDISWGVVLPSLFRFEDILKLRPASSSSRAIQQWWGQDFRRAQDPLYWIKKSFAANVHHLLDPDTYLIEESCRQFNEGQYIHALGGVVIDLAPLKPPTEAEATAQSHSVEQAAMSWTGDLKVNMADYFNRPDNVDSALHTEQFLAPIVKFIDKNTRLTYSK